MSTTLQSIPAALNWQLRVGENFVSTSAAALYGVNPATTTGLTLGYLGGNFNGVAVTTGTVALTASNTNYVVAHRTTGAVTAATTTTNWANTGVYLPLYMIVAGASTMSSIDDFRQAFGVAATGSAFTGGTLSSALNEAPAVTIASAGTVNIGAAAANTVKVTGTTTITAFDSIADGAIRRVIFSGTLTLTHNATSLILPTGANITTAAGDVAEFISIGSGNWRCSGYLRANGQALAATGGAAWGSLTGTLSAQTDLQAALDAKGAAGIPQNSQSAAYTLVLSDANKHIYHPAADTTARTWTIPANSSVAFPIGTAVTFDNDFGAGAITIAITTDTMVLVGPAGSTGSRTLASGGQATAIKVTATRWRINGTGLT